MPIVLGASWAEGHLIVLFVLVLTLRVLRFCNTCSELEGCNKFDWLGEGSASLKQRLKENTGKTKQDLTRNA